MKLCNRRPSKCSNQRWNLYLKQNGKCYYCHKISNLNNGAEINDDTFTIDHITPSSRKGSNKNKNKIGACFFCNQEKADMTHDEYFRLKYKEATGEEAPRSKEFIKNFTYNK